jgi:hypothetical protein
VADCVFRGLHDPLSMADTGLAVLVAVSVAHGDYYAVYLQLLGSRGWSDRNKQCKHLANGPRTADPCGRIISYLKVTHRR